MNLEALWAWRTFGPGCPLGLEALRPWRPCGPGGPAGLDTLRYWRLSEPGGPLGRDALWAWIPCGTGATQAWRPYYSFGLIRQLFQLVF